MVYGVVGFEGDKELGSSLRWNDGWVEGFEGDKELGSSLRWNDGQVLE